MKAYNFSNFTLRLGAIFLLLLSIILFSGCSKSPVGNTDTNSGIRLLSRVPADGTAFKILNLYSEQIISASEGGRLELYDVILDIPAGAVDNDTLFSISIPDVNVFYNEFGTSGLVFNVPVTVTMSYRDADLSGIDVSTIRIAYLNEATGTYEDINCQIDYNNQVVIAELYHFSAYGLISDEQ
ncbi:MAG: hypothetical protein KAR42_00410 [candidate division Zixibacteria bacterium]|nr:hypothetical protein [candidate division Zixibacteria bacterium]